MNNERRKTLKSAIKLIEEAKGIIESVYDDESFAFDNLNEGLQATMRGQSMEECIGMLEEVIEAIDDTVLQGLNDCLMA